MVIFSAYLKIMG